MFGLYARNEGSAGYQWELPDPDDPDPKPKPVPWITLMFTMVAEIALYFGLEFPDGVDRNDDEELRELVKKKLLDDVNAAGLGEQGAKDARGIVHRVFNNTNIEVVAMRDGVVLKFTPSTKFPSIGGSFPALEDSIARLEADGLSMDAVAADIVANSPYFRPGADGGDDDASLNGLVPRDRWPGLRTRDEMRAECNKPRPKNLREA